MSHLVAGDDVASGTERLKAGWFWNVGGSGFTTGLVCSEESELSWRVTSAEGQELCLGSGLNEH